MVAGTARVFYREAVRRIGGSQRPGLRAGSGGRGSEKLNVRHLLGRSARRLSLAVVAAVLLAGCAGRPEGALIPVDGTVAGASVVNMVVATVRKPVDGPDVFSGERAPMASYAEIDVSIPPEANRQAGDVQWPRSVPGNPATDFVTLKLDRIDQSAAIQWFNRRIKATPGRSALVFVHGYNQRFDDAVFRFAQILHDSSAEVTPVLFTWPSRGSLLAYGYDRESTSYSRDSLEKLLTFMARDPNVKEITVLAHSMGNVVTLEALRQMAIRNGRILPKIRNVILAAPDVDVDVFSTFFREIGNPRPTFTVFVSQDDKALAVSKRVWGDVPRVGQVNPEQEPYRSQFEREQVNVIDLTKLKTADLLNHGKFAASPEVVRAIGTRLAQGQTLTDSRVGVGERIVQLTSDVATTAGTAAGLVIAAPVAVVDPNTRNQYGNHLGQLGNTVTDTAESGVKVITPPPMR